MYFFKGIVYYYCDDESYKDTCLVPATSFNEAAQRITEYYGDEDILSMKIYSWDDCENIFVVKTVNDKGEVIEKCDLKFDDLKGEF